MFDFIDFIERHPINNMDELLTRVLRKARKNFLAEAGTVFMIKTEDDKCFLESVSTQNDHMDMAADSFIIDLNHQSIVGYVALTKQPIVIDDVYNIPSSYPFGFHKGEDLRNNYRTHSILCYPLTNFGGDVIGVIQLLNHMDPETNLLAPFDPEALTQMHTINQILGRAIERVMAMEKITEQNEQLTQQNMLLSCQKDRLETSQEETEKAFMLSVRLLAKAAEIHDKDTGNHILRVGEYSRFLAEKLGMDENFCQTITYSAQLHDVGKMSIDSSILKKKGRLLPEEWDEMRLHPWYGYQILSQSDRFGMAAEIAYAHHERWDGTGYPRQLKGKDIPISARIVQVADIYDALRSSRSYKVGLSHEKAFDIMTKGDDRTDPKNQFDPEILDVFKRYQKSFNEIWVRFTD
jgi:HD-GYP domain-containing protein (c-di-GMP phosphodiesterase class II)